MNNKKIRARTMKKPSTIIAVATIIAIVSSAAMILGMHNQISQNALAQSYGSNRTASNSAVSVNPNRSTNKEFWINTVHLDGMNQNGTINAIPIIGYHNIITYLDVSDTNESSATTLNLFDAEMKYLHDNGFRVLTMADLGYDENSNSLYIKTIGIVHV